MNEIIGEENQEYEHILCERDADGFRGRVKRNLDDDNHQKMGGVAKPNTIPELRIRCVPDDLSRKDVAVYLLESGLTDAMLVSRHDRKPVGVVSLTRVVRELFEGGIVTKSESDAVVGHVRSWYEDAFAKPTPKSEGPAEGGADEASPQSGTSTTSFVTNSDDDPLKEAKSVEDDDSLPEEFYSEPQSDGRDCKAA